MSECVDKMCSCLDEGRPEEECKCQVLEDYVKQCLKVQPDADIDEWRRTSKCGK